jgi:hypothetical protein
VEWSSSSSSSTTYVLPPHHNYDPLTQVLLSEDGVKLDSLNALRLMCPWAVLGLVPAVWLIEGTEPWDALGYLWDNRYTSYSAAAVGLNILMAFLVNLLNLLVTKHTNALTIQVLVRPAPPVQPHSTLRTAQPLRSPAAAHKA